MDENDKYTIKKQIGKGAFSSVYISLNKTDGENYALKRLLRKSYFETEIELLTKISGKCHNVCSMIECIEYAKETCIIFPLYKSNLYEYRNSVSRLSDITIYNFIIDIMMGLKFIKDNGIIHGDLKPENLMITNDNDIVIIDFGNSNYAIRMNHQKLDYFQSRYYRSPNIILGKKITFNIDMWSFGCIIYEMITNNVLFPGRKSITSRTSNNQLLLYINYLDIPDTSYLEDCRQKDLYFIKNVDTSEYEVLEPNIIYTSKQKTYTVSPDKTITRLDNEMFQILIDRIIKYDDIITIEEAIDYMNKNKIITNKRLYSQVV